MASVRLFRAALEVGELAAACRFYESLLGIKPRPVGGGRAYADCDDVILALVAVGDAPHAAALLCGQRHALFGQVTALRKCR